MSKRLLALCAPMTLIVLFAACGKIENDSTPTATGPSPLSTTTSAPTSGGSAGGSNTSAPSCTPSISGIPNWVPAQADTYSFSIATAAGCAWTAASDAAWAIISPLSGQGSATAVLKVDANVVRDGRAAVFTINGQTFRMTQNTACAFTLSHTSLNQESTGGTARVDLSSTLPDCPWTAWASEPWIQVLTPSGSGSANVRFNLDENTVGERHAFATIAGQRVNITQRARGL